MKYDVFISYSRKDTTIADAICAALDKQHISYFIDRQGIGGGMEFPIIIAEAILNSELVLFLASKNSYASKFTNNEVTFAFNKKPAGSIIPYLIDKSTLPTALEFTFSSINMRSLEEHPIDTVLVKDICQLLGRHYSESLSLNEKSEKTTDVENTNGSQVEKKKEVQHTKWYLGGFIGIILLGLLLWLWTSNNTNTFNSELADSTYVGDSHGKVLSETELKLKEVIHNWDIYHHKGYEHLLTSLYANNVKFYGMVLKRQIVAKKISESLDKNEYTQNSDNLKFTRIDSVNIRCDLNKTVTEKGSTKMYPSYLIFNLQSGMWFITEESDDVTDRNIGREK